jgi:predicted chitinase
MTGKNTGLLEAIQTPSSPFPGLRPFEYRESHLFFGRDGQIEKLLDKLTRMRFLAVVGASGSGKSSLVRAGLTPALRGGMMTGAGSNWRVAVMRPSNDPIGNLARALNAPDVFGSDDTENAAIQIAVTEATLRLGSRGLIETVRQNATPDNENLLVVVDQFEELFRFAREARKVKDERFDNDAAAFVKLLLEAVKPGADGQREANIYVALTMRSDFLGDCAAFWDLPEAINESQYLIPRLTPDQLREVITGPVALCGGGTATRLVNQLLNDIGDDQDQLPILQHALMRTWNEWKRPERHASSGAHDVIDLCCYEAIGGMANALSKHADEAFDELPDDRHRRIAEKFFRSLTEKEEDNREIRRPVTLGELCAVAESGEDEVKTVIETFRRPGRSFLMPPEGTPLHSETLIDISHESLIRVWDRLQHWVKEEAESAAIYLRLVGTASLHNEGKSELWHGADLQAGLDWKEKNNPTAAWARRYNPDFETAIAFLLASEHKRAEELAEVERRRQEKVERAKRELAQAQALAEAQMQAAEAEKQKAKALTKAASRLRRFNFAMIGIALLTLIAALIVFILYRRAESAKSDAENQRWEAVGAKLDANGRALEANIARLAAEKAKDEAESLRKEAEASQRKVEIQAKALKEQIEKRKKVEQENADLQARLNRQEPINVYYQTLKSAGSAAMEIIKPAGGTTKGIITDEALNQIMPTLSEVKRSFYLPFLQKAMDEFEINTPLRRAAFLAQIAHESGELRFLEELWGPTENQRRYDTPGELAKRLGNTEPGDGKRYKGRGVIQITGRSSYKKYSELLGLDLINNPDLAATPAVVFRTGALYWKVSGLNELADAEDFISITKRINGGTSGLADRVRYYELAKKALGVPEDRQPQ